jgi:NADH dehydrogenase [ubiquinone] 1 alpha subcomplex assembly factor 7
LLQTTGPISIAAYMRQCLTSPQGGYYTTTRGEETDQFGRKGDFITSPEISQVFGELVGIWFVTEWMAQGRKSSGVQLVEFGPGRGTLMGDVLRTITTFQAFAKSVEAIYLVEAGEGMRETQKRVLCGEEKAFTQTDRGWSCESNYEGLPVVWVEDINLLPKDETKAKMPLIIAHEFFDALPIHAFESVAGARSSVKQQGPKATTSLLDSTGKPLTSAHQPPASHSTATAPQWRELLVTPTPKRSHPSLLSTQAETDAIPDFQLTLSKASTPTSLVLPEFSPRYKALKAQAGSSIEISPDSLRHVSEFARRIGGSSLKPSKSKPQTQTHSSSVTPSGAALIIDYGPASTIPINSLRGIKNHKRVSPFIETGLVDLSADVDFTALAEAALQASPGVEVWGPVEQGAFLGELGGEARIQQLVEGVGKANQSQSQMEVEEKKKILQGSWKRLVDRASPQGMGRIYKALAVVPEGGGKRPPVGFGGRVVGP